MRARRLCACASSNFAAAPLLGLFVSGRSRIEGWFRIGSAKVGWRLLQYIRSQLPLASAGPVRADARNKTFIGLNDTRWGQRTGIDQVRTFIDASLPVAKGITVEPGYLNQTVFRVGPDRVNHILAANVFARF